MPHTEKPAERIESEKAPQIGHDRAAGGFAKDICFVDAGKEDGRDDSENRSDADNRHEQGWKCAMGVFAEEEGCDDAEKTSGRRGPEKTSADADNLCPFFRESDFAG